MSGVKTEMDSLPPEILQELVLGSDVAGGPTQELTVTCIETFMKSAQC